ncbi:hypothetical protein SAMN05216191_11421 [Paenibacillus jilunlii]|uniref:Uncharacterized protein n=1 Tax=Paenibacillus jilunlii TaxID=682956 RepID=A0A1G9U5P1_9BACL|nr:hypothetical protein SAMN05216191_11421 [Paenibacillus jilunlii]
MIPAGNSKPNIERFLGFQDEYDRYRPEAPPIVIERLTRYLGRCGLRNRTVHLSLEGCSGDCNRSGA